GDYCVSGTTEGSCAGDFYGGSSCETFPDCEVGCCIMADGTCGSGGSKLACDSIEDAVFNTGSCEDYGECALGCCWLGSEYDVDMTYEECLVKYEDSGLTPNFDEGISLEQCYSYVAAEEQGCCVSLEGCMYDTAEMCDEMDSDSGYGFYPGQYCTDVSDYLVDGEFEAVCECESSDEVKCFGQDLYAMDTCGFEDGLIESCPDGEWCSDMYGECVTTSCEDTFSFPAGTEFEKFNSYDVYYEENSGIWDSKKITLGDKRKNTETWCIYEGPVGSFRDRPGTQHYRVGCVDGEERVQPCGTAREEVCVAGYNEDLQIFTAECVPNNFETFYGEVYHGTGVSTPLGEEYSQPFSEPIENSDGTSGVSSVPTATNDCGLATFTCETVYGTTENSGASQWEIYINSLCLRPEFAKTAADYCSSRGDCGLDINILGEAGEVDGFDVSKSRNGIRNSEIGYGESCFEQNKQDDDEDAEWFQVSCPNKNIDICTDDGPCIFYDENEITDDFSFYYYGLDSASGIVGDLITNYMMPPYFNTQNLCDLSGLCYQVPDHTGTLIDCLELDQRISALTKNLGSNVGYNEIGSDLFNCAGFDYCDTTHSAEDFIPEFYNVFRTYKPWVLNEEALSHYSLQEDIQNWDLGIRRFVQYLGEVSCQTENSDFQNCYDDSHVEKVDIGYECKPFVGPSDNKCDMCNVSIEEGGLVFTKDGEFIEDFSTASICNEFRCRSLGEDCFFVAENEGTNRDVCVEEECADLISPEITIHEDVLDEQGYSAETISDGGYTVSDISFTLFEFGVVTDKMAECKFVTGDQATELWEMHGVNGWGALAWELGSESELSDDEALYEGLNAISPMVTPDDGGRGTEHTITRSIENSGEEIIYYVFCENICGASNAIDHYQVNLIAGEIPPSDFPKNYVYVLPESGSQLPNGQATYEVDIRMDREANCKYSATEPLDYASMVDEFSFCGAYDEDEYGMLGEFECTAYLPLENGTNNFYFWCEDTYGNSWESSETWSVSVTDILEISYVYPSGNTLYYNDVEMQINTDVGSDGGNSVCAYKRADWVSYIDFINTGTSLHTQSLEDLSAANYEYAIKCEDEVGNVAESEITFTIAVDSDAPVIENVYYLG
ncbi:hypothetical protein HOE07_05775, partial [archaeon]|nr:hypothetical protein [archaeon]